MSKPRIIIGTVEIGGSIAVYAREFRKLGYDVKTIVLFKNWAFADEEYDAVCIDTTRCDFQASLKSGRSIENILMYLKFGVFGLTEFFKSLGTNNWFIFLYGSNFLPFHYSFPFLNFIDYAILKKRGNIIVSMLLGCDIRDRSSFSYFAQKYDIPDICGICSNDYKNKTKCDPARAKRVAKGVEKYSDLVLTCPSTSFLLKNPYYFWWLPLEINNYYYKIPKNNIPIIIHAPTEEVTKGTNLIQKTLNKLKKDGLKFEINMITRQPNREIKVMLREADILIDQLYSVGTGKLTVEGLASGCAVLCGLDKKFQKIPAECPVIKITPETLYQKLRELLEDKEKIYQAAKAGREYVKNYHNSSKVVKDLIRLIEEHPRDKLIQPYK